MPSGDRLLQLLAPEVERGQLAFANALRRYVHEVAPEVFVLLDFQDDDAFLEPMAFALASGDESSSADVALAYAAAISPDQRPELEVLSDDAGRVFIPGLGYLSGHPARSVVRLVPSPSAPLGYASLGSEGVATALSEWLIGYSRPSLLAYPIPMLSEKVADVGGRLTGVEHAAKANRDIIRGALASLACAWPSLAEMFQQIVRHIVLFEDPEQNSFAMTAAHGIAFVNVHFGRSEAYFAEDLAHQCGHILFTAACEGAEPLLTVAPETPVDELIGREDHRTLEVALHGMITQALMVGVLDRLVRSDADIDPDEATARLLFALVRLGLDLRVLSGLDAYSDVGAALLRELIASYTETAERYRGALAAVDFGDQPYNFDYGVYLARNAGPRARVRS